MRYRMREKLFSIGGRYTIQDAEGRDVFLVEGKVLSIGDKLRFLDMEGNELAFISQKMLSFKPRYELYRGGEKFAEVIKEFTFFKNRFTLDLPGPNDFTIQGDFIDREYSFDREGRTVARVSKKFLSFADSYSIDIEEGQDDIAILAACVVIDLVLHEKKQDQGPVL